MFLMSLLPLNILSILFDWLKSCKTTLPNDHSSAFTLLLDRSLNKQQPLVFKHCTAHIPTHKKTLSHLQIQVSVLYINTFFSFQKETLLHIKICPIWETWVLKKLKKETPFLSLLCIKVTDKAVGQTEVSDCTCSTNLCDLGWTYSSLILSCGMALLLTTRQKWLFLSWNSVPWRSRLVTDASLTRVHCRARQHSLLYCRVGPGVR